MWCDETPPPFYLPGLNLHAQAPACQQSRTPTSTAFNTTATERELFVFLMASTKVMSPEQVRDYLSNHRLAVDRLDARWSSGAGIEMGGADWVISVVGASTESSIAVEWW